MIEARTNERYHAILEARLSRRERGLTISVAIGWSFTAIWMWARGDSQVAHDLFWLWAVPLLVITLLSAVNSWGREAKNHAILRRGWINAQSTLVRFLSVQPFGDSSLYNEFRETRLSLLGQESHSTDEKLFEKVMREELQGTVWLAY